MLTLLAISACLILLQIQAINSIMCTAIFLRKTQIIIPRKFNKEVWQDLRPRRFWVRLARTSAWWDNDDDG